jgi:predicted transcriptional regulator
MHSREHVLISLAPRHADNILNGVKSVEFRRRTMHISPGAIIWIYVKLPVGSIVARVKVASVHQLSPTTLWKRFGAVSGLTRGEFFGYFRGVKRGAALVLEDCRRLHQTFSLAALREIDGAFHPPQFFSRLHIEDPLFNAIASPNGNRNPYAA